MWPRRVQAGAPAPRAADVLRHLQRWRI